MTASARGRSNRKRGLETQCDASKVLTERDWAVISTAGGMKNEDMVATDPDGVTWSVEVKNKKTVRLEEFRKQAMEQANKRKLPWLLMVKIQGESGAYLVQGKHKPATVWRRKECAQTK